MRFEVHFGTENAAFEDEGRTNEIVRILRELADRIDGSDLECGDTLRLKDVNGNRVGFAALTDADGPSE